MNSYQCQVHFQSEPSAVYAALTTPEGLQGWWTVDCDVQNFVGGKHSFRFEGVLFNAMEVTALEPYARVQWKCVEGWDEWRGTEVLFTLAANPAGGTDLVFEHRGLTPALKCYKMCANGWDTFIQNSLPHYVDLGTGEPHVPKTGFKGAVARTAFKVFSARY
jgi:uncharacterized protein YndB with AHSA1/START domain